MTPIHGRRSQLSRRTFLRGLSGITLSLPFLEKLNGVAFAQSAGASGPRRVIVVAYEMGVPLGQWRPTAVGSDFELPFVTAPLEAFRERCLFVSSIDNSVLDMGGNQAIFGHPGKREAALTGTLTTGSFPSSNGNRVEEVRSGVEPNGGANGPSVESVIGASLRGGQVATAINLGVNGSTWRPTNPAPATRNSSFFYEGRANAVTMQMHPSVALNGLFAGMQAAPGPSKADLALQQLRARNKSVLDAVRDSFRDLAQGLGREDRARLEDHAARIRQLELDVQASATCTSPGGIATVADYSGFRMDQLAPLHIRILAHGMACNMAPVGRLEFMSQGNPRFGIPSVDNTLNSAPNGYDWHAMVHGDPLPGSSSYLRPGRDDRPGARYDPRLLDGYRYFVQQFADLLAELDAIPEGPDTSALDHSMVVLASDLGEGLGHGHQKMGYVLAGNLGGARTGYHFDAGPDRPFEVGGTYFGADSRYSVSQLLNSMLDMAGATDEQGNAASIGLKGYLERVGAPRRIDDLFV